MQYKELLSITVITDDSTGIYQVGELDFGVSYTTKDWLDKSGNREKLAYFLQWLSNQCRNSQTPFTPRMTQQEFDNLQKQLENARLEKKENNGS